VIIEEVIIEETIIEEIIIEEVIIEVTSLNNEEIGDSIHGQAYTSGNETAW